MGRFIFKLPDVGEGTAEAEIVTWYVKAGDRVHEDQNLVDVMTDKATVEMTSPVAGTVVAVHGNPGEMAAVGAPLVEFELDGAEAPKEEKVPAAAPAAAAVEKEKPETAEAAGKTLASPAVRRRAADLGIALHLVQGTGPGGRITHADLDSHLTASGAGRPVPAEKPAPKPAVAGDAEEVKVIGLRRRIAEKMQDSKRHIPHFAYVEEIDMTALEAERARLNAARGDGKPKLTVLPFLMRALVRALPEFPQVNAHFDDEAGIVHRYKPVHIGIATQTDAGLMVPVVKDAGSLDLWQAASEVARLAALARAGKAAKDELTGSTITITSLGPMAGVVTTPIINRPEVAIIGPNAIVERPVVRGGQIVVRKMMNLSSSFDHRVVDGADAAAFVQKIKALLEQPEVLLRD